MMRKNKIFNQSAFDGIYLGAVFHCKHNKLNENDNMVDDAMRDRKTSKKKKKQTPIP